MQGSCQLIGIGSALARSVPRRKRRGLTLNANDCKGLVYNAPREDRMSESQDNKSNVTEKEELRELTRELIDFLKAFQHGDFDKESRESYKNKCLTKETKRV